MSHSEAPVVFVRYRQDDDDGTVGAVQFNMYRALLGVGIVSSYFGWVVSSYLPLLPRGLGALISACCGIYTTSLSSPLGDLLR